MAKTAKYIPEWMRARSERSKASWQKRWDRGTAPIGKKGAEYIAKTYGPAVAHEAPLEYEEEEYDDYDFWDSETSPSGE